MPNMSLAEVIAHEERISRGRNTRTATTNPALRETGPYGLHQQIINHCNAQWPRWKFLHSRTDRKSTVEVGSHDFTIFLPKGRVLCLECKAKGGKLSSEQLGWIHEMKTLDHPVWTIYSFAEFLELVES